MNYVMSFCRFAAEALAGHWFAVFCNWAVAHIAIIWFAIIKSK